MLDVNLVTDDLEGVAKRLALRRQGDLGLEAIRDLNLKRKKLQKERDDLVHEARELGPSIAQKKKAGEDASALLGRSTAIKERQKELEGELRQVEAELEQRLLLLPNLPHPDAPVGGEDDFRIVREWGAEPTFTFAPKDHIALCEATGIVELGERAVKLARSSFVVWMGQGARLTRGLINFFLDLHTTEHGYTEVSPPFLVNARTATGTGQLPKFKDELFTVTADDLYLVPTAEVPVTNLHQEEIIPGERLPVAYCAYTPCFRREAGAAGKLTKGLKRLHQFDKVELVRFCRPEESDQEHQRLLAHAEEPLKRLGLRYRVKELATGDTGNGAARCYDLEAWAPGSKEWLEVSSVSTFTDYQARRANIRYKDKPSAEHPKPKTTLVHTLNGSGLALPRVVIAILETYQRADGKITVPPALRGHLGGLEVLG
jgi:seryl-tRNA synthetase